MEIFKATLVTLELYLFLLFVTLFICISTNECEITKSFIPTEKYDTEYLLGVVLIGLPLTLVASIVYAIKLKRKHGPSLACWQFTVVPGLLTTLVIALAVMNWSYIW